MPYFKNNEINILFIHIPKTGGSSLENYFSFKYNISLDDKSLFCKLIESNHDIIINSSPQHMTYQTILQYQKEFSIDFNNIKIITIVRNPYERIISDLFFLKKITIDNKKEEIYDIIKIYLLSDDLDNHNIPQHTFITDSNKVLIPDLIVLRTETLTNDMHNLGYDDFDIYANANANKEINYYQFLNDDSIKLINEFYDYDFELFNYKRIISNSSI